MAYKGFTEAQARASKKYMSQFVESKIRWTEERREIVRKHAESKKESLNGFINRAIDETMARDNSKQSDTQT